MECPNCNNDNPAGSKFCQYCRYDLTAVSAATNPAPAGVSQEQAGQSQQVHQQTAKPRPIMDTYKPIGQLGTGGTAVAGVWTPFAKLGTRGRHASWLIDERGDKAEELHEAVTERFHHREIPGSNMHWENLRAKGLLVEQRPFYFVKRGITTIALYISQFGRDLYISQVTYIKGPISNVRAIIFFMLVFFVFFYRFIILKAAFDSAGSFLDGLIPSFFGDSNGSNFPFFSLCVLGPLWLLDIWLLGLAFLYSIYKWLRERDFLAILRARPNEFQEDDTIALEKAIEETVRQALDAIDIPSALMQPAQEYGSGRRFI